jgi:hypothetical protein
MFQQKKVMFQLKFITIITISPWVTRGWTLYCTVYTSAVAGLIIIIIITAVVVVSPVVKAPKFRVVTRLMGC